MGSSRLLAHQLQTINVQFRAIAQPAHHVTYRSAKLDRPIRLDPLRVSLAAIDLQRLIVPGEFLKMALIGRRLCRTSDGQLMS